MKRYDLDEYGGNPYPHEDGEWVKHEDICKAEKTKEFCMGVCCNRDEYSIFQEYGKECPNCPVDGFMGYYGLGG